VRSYLDHIPKPISVAHSGIAPEGLDLWFAPAFPTIAMPRDSSANEA
jgi:stage V sporulation protein SpoVS